MSCAELQPLQHMHWTHRAHYLKTLLLRGNKATIQQGQGYWYNTRECLEEYYNMHNPSESKMKEMKWDTHWGLLHTDWKGLLNWILSGEPTKSYHSSLTSINRLHISFLITAICGPYFTYTGYHSIKWLLSLVNFTPEDCEAVDSYINIFIDRQTDTLVWREMSHTNIKMYYSKNNK